MRLLPEHGLGFLRSVARYGQMGLEEGLFISLGSLLVYIGLGYSLGENEERSAAVLCSSRVE